MSSKGPRTLEICLKCWKNNFLRLTLYSLRIVIIDDNLDNNLQTHGISSISRLNFVFELLSPAEFQEGLSVLFGSKHRDGDNMHGPMPVPSKKDGSPRVSGKWTTVKPEDLCVTRLSPIYLTLFASGLENPIDRKTCDYFQLWCTELCRIKLQFYIKC